MNITLGEFFDMMEENGYKKVKGEYIDYENGRPTGGCAFGQAAMNLDCNPSNLSWAVADKFPNKGNRKSLRDKIFNANDNTNMAVSTIARKFRKEYAKFLDTVLEIE